MFLTLLSTMFLRLAWNFWCSYCLYLLALGLVWGCLAHLFLKEEQGPYQTLPWVGPSALALLTAISYRNFFPYRNFFQCVWKEHFHIFTWNRDVHYLENFGIASHFHHLRPSETLPFGAFCQLETGLCSSTLIPTLWEHLNLLGMPRNSEGTFCSCAGFIWSKWVVWVFWAKYLIRRGDFCSSL